MAATAPLPTTDKYYSSIGGFREHSNYPHDSSAAHRGGSNSPPFRFGAPSPQQSNRNELEQHWQPAASAPVRRSPPGGSFASSASTRPGNLLRPLPGWSAATAPANQLGFHPSNAANFNDSPFTYNAPPLSYSVGADHKTQFNRKRPYPDTDGDDESRSYSSRPATRSGRDHVDELPRPTSRRLSVMELCNTQSGGGGNGLPDGFDSRPRTSSGRFTSATSGTGPLSNGPSSSFSFPAPASNANVGNQHSNAPGNNNHGGSTNGLRPSSSSGVSSRPSSSAGRGLEQYALNLGTGAGGSSRPGSEHGQNDDSFPGLGRRASTGIILPPLHLSSAASNASPQFAFSGRHDAHRHGRPGSGRDGHGGDGLAGAVTSNQSGISTPRQAAPGLRV